jgi:hypothetical protein
VDCALMHLWRPEVLMTTAKALKASGGAIYAPY